MEESDDEYIPSFDEEDIFVTPPPREKRIGKRHYPFKCKECDERFLSGVTLLVHERLAHPAKAFPKAKHVCPQCLKIFTSSYNNSRHLGKQHEDESSEDIFGPEK